ncbi:MAG: DUF3084 domain-containing protein [Candidatus Zipacnadales bacterium]
MRVYSIAFIVALLAFGGLAAYLGDVLGYRLGKRRLSLLHLRPRTTARLVGILAGILIPAVTVSLGALLVPEVRLAVLKIDSIRSELAQLTAERNTMREERNLLRRTVLEERTAVKTAHADAKKSRAELGDVKRMLGAAREELGETRLQVGHLRDETGRLRGDRDAAKQELTKARAALNKAEEVLIRAEERLTKVESELDEVENQRDKLLDERNQLQSEADRLKAEVAELRRTVQIYELRHTMFAERDPVLELGTELVRAVIRKPPDVDALTDELLTLYLLADEAAQNAGAGRGDNDRYVRVIWPVPRDYQGAPGQEVPEETVMGLVRRELFQHPAPEHVVRVIVYRRAFAGEQVGIGFEARPNHLVYHEGETLVSRKLSPGLSEAEAFEQLWVLIADPKRSEVRRQAQAARLLPDPESGRYGVISIRDIYHAAERCAGRPSSVTVRVEAAADTYTQGPLRIRIIVEPTEAKP